MSGVGTVAAVGLSKAYGRRYALRKASFELRAGEITAVIGQNGAGKSTTFHLLAGRMAPTSGQVQFDGRVAGREEWRRRACGYVSHASFLYGTLTARENLVLLNQLYGLEGGVDSVLEQVGLDRASDRLAREFSRGMVQRLALGRLLLTQPSVWLLDEPASGLDEAGRRWLVGEVRRAAADGRVVALSSHSRAMVGELATQAVVLRRGRLEHTGPVSGPDEVDRLFREYIG